MTSDCYAILGVTPAAEDVVIGAAYRALMRHYHPDTNHDPAAQARAQQISAAYAVLRDPARRAEYDAQRGADRILWDFDEPADRPPPMRTAGIATAVLAVVLVGAVWAWPRPADLPADVAATHDGIGAAVAKDAPAQRRPSIETVAGGSPANAPVRRPVLDRARRIEPMVVPRPAPVQLARAERSRARPPAAAPPAATPAGSPAVASAQVQAAEPKPGGNDRVATLDRMSAGFFNQSMVHASTTKKTLLLAARDRSAAQRKACRSDTCIADAYVRYIRETSTIMESRGGPK